MSIIFNVKKILVAKHSSALFNNFALRLRKEKKFFLGGGTI